MHANMDRNLLGSPTLVLFHATPDLHECCPSSRIAVASSSESGNHVILTPRYTVLVESIKEYCRIAWDVLPLEKSVKVCLVRDSAIANAYACNTWNAAEQNIGTLNNGFAECFSAAPDAAAYSAALAVISSEARDVQVLRTAGVLFEQLTDSGACNELTWLGNHSTLRVIYVHTDAFDDAVNVETLLMDALTKVLEKSALLSKLTSITCTTVLIRTTAPDQPLASSKLSPQRVFAVQGNTTIYREFVVSSCQSCFADIMSVLERHLSLCKAVVTNIPMKDESGQGASQDYDVSLYIFRNDNRSATDAAGVQPLYLKWLPPREVGQIDDDINQWVASCRRVCPVVPKSRPTQCLLQFVLKGKTVYLQQKQETVAESTTSAVPSKLSAPVLPVTHYIRTMPAGSIYLFEIDRDFQANRKVFNDIPAASASAGGKVENYCVGQVEDILKRFAFDMSLDSAVQILRQQAAGQPFDAQQQQFQQRITNCSRYFPLTYGQSLIPCSVELLELYNLLQEPLLTDAMLARTIQRIDLLMSTEQASGSKFLSVIAPISLSCVLSSPKKTDASGAGGGASAGAGRGRAHTKELWKALWSELIVLTESLADVSDAHRHVLEYLQRKRPGMPNQMLTFFRANNSHQQPKFFRPLATRQAVSSGKAASSVTGIPERRFLMPQLKQTFSDAIQKQTRADIEEGKRRFTLADLPRCQMAVGTNLYPNLPNPNERPFSFTQGSGGGGGSSSGSRGISSAVNMAKKAKIIVP